MNPATLIAFGAALLQAAFGTMFLLMGRAQGWARSRLFAVLAFSAAVFAAIDIAYTLPSIDQATLRVCVGLNYLMAAIHCAAWVVYAHAAPEFRWRDLARRHRAVVVATLALGLVVQIPGVITGPGLHVVEVPWMDSAYRQVHVTWFTGVIGGWLLAVLGMVFVRFVRDLRDGVPGALVQVAGFTVFFVCNAVEVLVVNGVIDFLYPSDLGFLAMIAVVLTETIRRILADARTLAALGRDLADQVERRTRERDVANEALTHAERLAAVGQLAAGVGHEINNPLTVVQVNLELLREQAGARADAELIDDALASVHRIARVVSDLRSYALPARDHREVVELPTVLRAALKLASHRLRHVATVEQALDELAPVRADAVRLSQVFVNLLVNAGQALEDGNPAEPRITIRGRMRGPDRVAIEIADNGVGIAADALPRLGEPYFSSRHGRGGTGLGLFVARNILTSVDGTLELESTPGQGTVARVLLPTVPPRAPRPVAAPVPEASGAPGPRRRALVIDDEPVVARSVARYLAGFDVTTCNDPTEALHLLQSDAVFDVVLCDLMMPGLSGTDLHAAVTASHPARVSRFLFMTGGAVTAAAEAFLASPSIRHILKPFTRMELMAAIEAVVSRPP